MYKGTTLTYTWVLDQEIDMSQADPLIVTFSTTKDYKGVFLKKQDGITTDGNRVSVSLSQQESLEFPAGRVYMMLNWLLPNGARPCTEPYGLDVYENQVNEVIE